MPRSRQGLCEVFFSLALMLPEIRRLWPPEGGETKLGLGAGGGGAKVAPLSPVIASELPKGCQINVTRRQQRQQKAAAAQRAATGGVGTGARTSLFNSN